MLAAAALATSYLFSSPDGTQLMYAVLGVYLAYSLLVALRSRSHTGMLGLLAIFGDTVYFLMMASYGGDHLLWIASFFFLFMITETLVFYSTVDGGDLTIMAPAQLRPQQVPARIADDAVAVGMVGIEMQQRFLVLVADGEDHVAALDRLRRHPAQLLLHGDEARHLLVDRGDRVAGRPGLGHDLAVIHRQGLEHDDARRHEAQILVDHPLPADDHLEAQRLGRARWYDRFALRVCKVEREYSFDRTRV